MGKDANREEPKQIDQIEKVEFNVETGLSVLYDSRSITITTIKLLNIKCQ